MSSSVHELYSNSLLLLGFEPAKEGIVLGKDLFKVQNEKCLQQLVHFLLLRWKPKLAVEFEFCWPIYDATQRTLWRKTTQKVLAELEKGGDLPAGSSQVSRLVSASGPRAENLIWNLSDFVLRQCLRTEYPEYQYVAPPSATAPTPLQVKGHSTLAPPPPSNSPPLNN
jgi:hypothetical protein